MTRQRLGLAVMALAAFVVWSGCQSTQDTSREIAASLGPVKVEKGLQITEPSRDVDVVRSTLLTDGGEAAVVVELRNKSNKALTNVPILIDVLDAGGKSVYRNDIPGIEPSLASVPLIRPNARVEWVNNQILAVGDPASVKVKVGASNTTLAGAVPDVQVRDPVLEEDPVSGTNARGIAINHSGAPNDRLLIYGIARRGGKIVAVGRAAIEDLKPNKPHAYHVFFVGDPSGAQISIASFPAVNST
jgi:hypothetical protein